MDCTPFENRLDELRDLMGPLENDIDLCTVESINKISCLLCKNQNPEIASEIVTYFERLIAENPFNHLYWYGLGRACQVVNNIIRAEEAYIKASTLDPLNQNYLERMARFFVQISEPEKAQQSLNRLLAINQSKQKISNYLMGMAYFNRKMYKETISCFEKGVDVYNFEYYQMLIHSYIQEKKFSEVIKLETEIPFDESDESFNLLALIGDAYRSTKQYGKAVEVYKKLSDKQPGKYENELAASYSDSNNFDEAVELFKEILSKQPDDELALANYALTLLKIDTAKNFDEAINLYKKVIEKNPKNVGVLSMLGMIFYEMQKYEDAYNYLIESYRLDQAYVSDLRKAILCTLFTGKSGDGLSLSQILKVDHNLFPLDYVIYGILYSRLGYYKEAAEYTLRAIKLEPTNSFYISCMAQIFYRQDDFMNAAVYYEKALLLDQKNVQLLSDYGNALLQLRKYDDCISTYLKAIEIERNGGTLNQLGWAYCEFEEFSKAMPHFLEAIRLPNSDLDFKDKIKKNFLYACVMSEEYRFLLDTLDSDKHGELFEDDHSNFVKAVVYLRLGEMQKAKESFNSINSASFPDYFFQIIKAFVIYNARLNDWSKICIKTFESLNTNEEQYLLFKEEISQCLGYSYREGNNLQKALESFKAAAEIGQNNAANWYEIWVTELSLGNGNTAMENFEKAYTCENHRQVRPLKYLFDKFKSHEDITSEGKAKIVSNFLELREKTNEIKHILKYTSKKPVYHYTRLSVLKELIRDDYENNNHPKLRMSNAAHMNDPSEGQEIFKLIGASKSLLPDKEVILSQNVFLSCFCNDGDALPLWVQYGDDAKGCSLEIEASFFDENDHDFYENICRQNMQNFKKEQVFSVSLEGEINTKLSDNLTYIKANLSEKINNTKSAFDPIKLLESMLENEYRVQYFDFMNNLFSLTQQNNSGELYCLYQVAYADHDNNIINIKTGKKNGINACLQKINDILLSVNNDFSESYNALAVWKEIAREAISQIQYLFKSSDYQHEKEVRLIKFESIDSDSVKSFADEDNIPMLYLDIERKLHFTQVMLGPKVTHPSRLAPALYRKNTIDKVVLSTIKYR